jgi:type II secretory pathway pseudopilin PulG
MKPFIVIAAIIAALLAAIIYPQWRERRMGGNEASAIGTMRTIASAQALYQSGGRSESKVPTYAPSLEALGKAGLVDPQIAAGTKKGYRFAINTATAELWNANGDPLEPGVTGTRHWYIDQTGVITFTNAVTGTAGPESPAISCTADPEPI